MTGSHSRQAGSDGMWGTVTIATGWVFAADRKGARNLAVGQVVAALSSLALVGASALLFKKLLRGEHYGSLAVLGPLFVFAFITSLTSLITGISTQRQRVVGERVQQAIWRRVLETVAATDLISYESEGFATHLARVEQNAVTRPLPTVRAVFALLGSALTALAVGVALCVFSPFLPLILFVAAVPTVLLGRAAARTEYGFARILVPMYMRRDYLRHTMVERAHAAELRAIGAFAPLRQRHDALDATMVAGLQIQVRRRVWMAVAAALASAVALIGALLAIVALVDTGRLTLAQAGAAAIAARLFGSALSGAYTAFGTLSESAPHIRDLDDFFRTASGAGRIGTRRVLHRALELSGVGFTYPTKQVAALSDISLTIRRGEVVALVGENGSGKSTLARIVAGLYPPDNGRVSWDGADSTPDDRLESTSLLTQDYGRYAFSVMDNIALGDNSVEPSPESIRRAGELAQFHHFVEDLPDGYETILGRDLDEGVDLSGGQWQRLALARTLFRQGDLLILDEPSSALDPRAESELFDDVRRVLQGRSALLISHRYASARLADHIYVLHAGRIAEHGTHAELMAADGRYAELFRLQSASFLAGISGFQA